MNDDKKVIATDQLKGLIRRRALEEGFDVVGFAAAQPPPHAEQLLPWLQAGWHGNMAWLAKEPEKRADPRRLLSSAHSVVVLGVSSRPVVGEEAEVAAGAGTVAVHARRPDYHELLKAALKRLWAWLNQTIGPLAEGRLLVDTAPILEKPLAVAAGLGWQGKNSLLVSPQAGCWLLLAEMVLPLPLSPDPLIADHCGSCRLCVEACPTDALAQPYRLHAKRCLAYMNIEQDGPFAPADRVAMATRLYGCDACIQVCPWNRFAAQSRMPAFLPRGELLAPSLLHCGRLDAEGFRALTGQTPLRRIGLRRWLRNVAIALGNWGAVEALPLLLQLLQHEAPLVRHHAAWGIGRLLEQYAGEPFGSEPCRCLREQFQQESDGWVREEMAAVLRRLSGHGARLS